jgi:hypothetical protein
MELQDCETLWREETGEVVENIALPRKQSTDKNHVTTRVRSYDQLIRIDGERPRWVRAYRDITVVQDKKVRPKTWATTSHQLRVVAEYPNERAARSAWGERCLRGEQLRWNRLSSHQRRAHQAAARELERANDAAAMHWMLFRDTRLGRPPSKLAQQARGKGFSPRFMANKMGRSY